MAYTGATDIATGTDTTNDLKREIFVGVLDAYLRNNIFSNLIWTKPAIKGAPSVQFIIEGKEDTSDYYTANSLPEEYTTSGTQLNVSNGTVDEVSISYDRPMYIARRVDKWDEATTSYDAVSMQVNQIGANLASYDDRKVSSAIELASLSTGLVGNGDGYVVVNTTLDGGATAGTTAEEIGDAYVESIFAGVSQINTNDVTDEIYCVLNPIAYSYLVQSKRGVSMDYTSGNGGIDVGKIYEVGGVKVFQSNNLPQTAGLKGLIFTRQAVGKMDLFNIQTKIVEQEDFLDAKFIYGYTSNGVGVLRPQCAISIKNV